MSRILIGSALVFLAACANSQDLNGDGIADAEQTGRSPNTVQLVAPSAPVGTVSGLVMTSLQTAIEGVNVTLLIGDGTDAAHIYKTTTTTDGAYVFKEVPGGAEGQLLFSKTGYSNAKVAVSVPATGGNIPINNGNGNGGVVTLAQLDTTVKFHVYTAAGEPAKGARALLEVSGTAWRTFNGSAGGSAGNYSGVAEADDTGTLTFTGAPNPEEMVRLNDPKFNLTIGALDTNNDDVPEFLGLIRGWNASELFLSPVRSVVLPDARINAPLNIAGSNVESFTVAASPPYRNAVKASEPINIVFNQAITQADATRLVKIVQEDCQTPVPAMVTSRAPNLLTITPSAPWTLGDRYNIIVRATGLESGTTVDFIGYFFAIDATAPRPLSQTGQFQVRKRGGNMLASALQPGDSLNVMFDTPITLQPGGPAASVYVSLDLNGDGVVGGNMGAGELNGPAGTGFQFTNNEQTTANDPAAGSFTCKQSGYSKRWSINIPFASFPAMGSIAASTPLRVIFPKDNTSSDTYQTAWGSPVTADVNGTLVVVP